MDFKTNSLGNFGNTRLGWLTDITTSELYNLGIQISKDGVDGQTQIHTYWNNGAVIKYKLAGPIATIANTWYTLRVRFTYLTSVSAKIDASLSLLGGAEVGSASIPDTSAMGSNAPKASHFAPSGVSTAMYPMFKNDAQVGATCDNISYWIQK